MNHQKCAKNRKKNPFYTQKNFLRTKDFFQYGDPGQVVGGWVWAREESDPGGGGSLNESIVQNPSQTLPLPSLPFLDTQKKIGDAHMIHKKFGDTH